MAKRKAKANLPKTPAFCLVDRKNKAVFAYKRKMDRNYHQCTKYPSYRPFIKHIDLDCHLKLTTRFKGYEVKGDF